jgi:hypothetical protein
MFVRVRNITIPMELTPHVLPVCGHAWSVQRLPRAQLVLHQFQQEILKLGAPVLKDLSV